MSFLNRIRNFWSFGTKRAPKADVLVALGAQSPSVNGVKLGRVLASASSLNPYGLRLQALAELRLKKLLPEGVAASLNEGVVAGVGLGLDSSANLSLALQGGYRFPRGKTLGVEDLELRSLMAGVGLDTNLVMVAARLSESMQLSSLSSLSTEPKELVSGAEKLSKRLAYRLFLALQKEMREAHGKALQKAEDALKDVKAKVSGTPGADQDSVVKSAEATLDLVRTVYNTFANATTEDVPGQRSAPRSLEVLEKVDSLKKAVDAVEVAVSGEAKKLTYGDFSSKVASLLDAVRNGKDEAEQAKAFEELEKYFKDANTKPSDAKVHGVIAAALTEELADLGAKAKDAAAKKDWLNAESFVYRLHETLGLGLLGRLVAFSVSLNVSLKRLGFDRSMVLALSVLNGMVELTAGSVVYSIRD